MRITDSQRFATTLRHINTNSTSLARAVDRAATGLRYARLSEDPANGGKVMTIDSTLRALTQYQRTIDGVRGALAGEESVLQQVTDLLSRAKELASSQGGANATAASRQATAAEVRALREQAISLGNLQVGGEFVFGGLATDTPPFLSDGSYVGTANSRLHAIAPGQVVSIVHTGGELLVDSGVLGALQSLETALLSDDAAAVRAAIAPLDGAFDQVQTRLAEVGAGDRRLELASAVHRDRTDALRAERASIAEIPIDEASLDLAAAQGALESSFLATTRMLSLNLVDFLR